MFTWKPEKYLRYKQVGKQGNTLKFINIVLIKKIIPFILQIYFPGLVVQVIMQNETSRASSKHHKGFEIGLKNIVKYKTMFSWYLNKFYFVLNYIFCWKHICRYRYVLYFRKMLTMIKMIMNIAQCFRFNKLLIVSVSLI